MSGFVECGSDLTAMTSIREMVMNAFCAFVDYLHYDLEGLGAKLDR
jgi:hypothetical protein